MALLAEELVQEWLNRQGYFTIRGVKLGVHEMDTLAVRFGKSGSVECRHVEVQASVRPVSYISKVPKRLQKEGRAANSAKRTQEELVAGVKEWVDNKFRAEKKVKLMKSLCDKPWTEELVLYNVKLMDEVEMIRKQGIIIHWLKDIVDEMNSGRLPIQAASGADLLDLINIGRTLKEK